MTNNWGNKIRKIFYSGNRFIQFFALLGVVLAALYNYVLADVAVLGTILSIYTFLMYALAAAFVGISVAMIIRTVIKFRIIGLFRAIFYMIITAVLFIMYASMMDIVNIF